MKKTIFDKIVVGFVLLVIVIFSVLALYTVNMTQSKLLSNTEQNLKTESKLIISTTVTDYMNGLIDKNTFYQKLDEHAADMDAEIWLSTANGEIIYCSNSESPAAKDMMITDFYDRNGYIFPDSKNRYTEWLLFSKNLKPQHPCLSG